MEAKMISKQTSITRLQQTRLLEKDSRVFAHLFKFNSFFLVRGAFVGLQHCQFSPALLSLSFLQHCQFSAPSLNLCQLANTTKDQQKTLIMSFFRKYLLDSELWTAHRVWKYRHYNTAILETDKYSFFAYRVTCNMQELNVACKCKDIPV